MERATRYDAIIATLVGVSALVVSAYTAYVQRQQVRAQVYPILEMSSGFSDSDVHVELANKGSGPALIRDVRFTLDGRPVHGWNELFTRALGDDHARRDFHFSNIGHRIMAAGEHERSLEVSCSRPPNKPGLVEEPAGAKAMPTYRPADEVCARLFKMLTEMDVSICYCSTLGDCSVLTDGALGETRTSETRRCPAPSADSFN